MSTAHHFDSPVAQSGHVPRPFPLSTRAAEVRKAWRASLPLVIPVAIRVIPGPGKILAYVWTAAYALLGRRQAILALVLLWFFNMFTHAFGRPPGAAGLFRHLTVFAAAVSVLVIHAGAQPRSRTPKLLVWTAALNGMLIVHSLVFSTMPEISVLKTILFSVTFQVLLTAWSRLAPHDRAVTENQVWGVLCGLAVLSAPLVVMGSGYYKNGRGFQGLLEHPQAFGPTMGILAVWLFATWLTDRRMSFALKIVLGLAIAWVYLAQARVGAVGLVVGAAAAVAAGPLTALMNRSARVPRLLKRRLAVFITGGVLLLAAAGPFLAVKIQAFIFKSGRATTAIGAAWESRGHLVEAMRANIREHPLTGIGFGVASVKDRFAALARDPIFGLAIMATVEKGVLPVAMVEEMGWPLALLYGAWLLGLLLMAIRAGPRYAGVCAAAFAVNMGESMFFSTGGTGLIVQILVAMAATAPPARQDSLVAPAILTRPQPAPAQAWAGA